MTIRWTDYNMSNLKSKHEDEHINLETKKKENQEILSEEEQLTLFADIISNYIIKEMLQHHEEWFETLRRLSEKYGETGKSPSVENR